MILLEPDQRQSRPSDVERSQEPGRSEAIDKLVESLSYLHDAPKAALELMAFGQDAVGPLRRFLFRREPSGIYEPRCWAVRVLARIGACGVLVEFLSSRYEVNDPVERLGEEAVMNTAARALAQTPSEETYCALLELARRRPLPGVIETLGEFQREEVIPLLVAALEDDVARGSAEDVLRRLGDPASRHLVDAALRKNPAPNESPSSLRRRRSALRLLTEMRGARPFWESLHPLMDDRDESVAALACFIAIECGTAPQRQRAIQTLIDLLGTADWLLRSEIENTLIRNFEIARTAIRQASKTPSDSAQSRINRSLARILACAE
jgi:hypothetical protein